MKINEETKKIMFEKQTEKPFSSSLVYNKDKGIYKCKNCSRKLFDSKEKFDSNSGWPSFFDAKNIDIKMDYSHGMIRKEVLCKCGIHLGHFFEDGPKNSRYCINGACLEFDKSN